jgi:hypothetical protein
MPTEGNAWHRGELYSDCERNSRNGCIRQDPKKNLEKWKIGLKNCEKKNLVKIKICDKKKLVKNFWKKKIWKKKICEKKNFVKKKIPGPYQSDVRPYHARARTQARTQKKKFSKKKNRVRKKFGLRIFLRSARKINRVQKKFGLRKNSEKISKKWQSPKKVRT